MANVNIFCSNEAGELSVFCSKPLYLVGLCFSFNGSSDVTRGKERGSVFCCCVVDFRDLEGLKWKLEGFFFKKQNKKSFTFCISVNVVFFFFLFKESKWGCYRNIKYHLT